MEIIMENLKKTAVGTVTAVISWLMLSFVFFPVPQSEISENVFAESIAYMLPLKAVITLIFILLAIFMYEQRAKKKIKEEISVDNVSK